MDASVLLLVCRAALNLTNRESLPVTVPNLGWASPGLCDAVYKQKVPLSAASTCAGENAVNALCRVETGLYALA